MNSTNTTQNGDTNSEKDENQTSIKQVQTNPTLRSTFSTLNYNSLPSSAANSGVVSPPSANGNYQMSALNYEKRSSVCNMTFGGGSDKCARCTKPVYAAEKIVAAGKVIYLFI